METILIPIIGDFGPANVREGLKWLFETLMVIIEWRKKVAGNKNAAKDVVSVF